MLQGRPRLAVRAAGSTSTGRPRAAGCCSPVLGDRGRCSTELAWPGPWLPTTTPLRYPAPRSRCPTCWSASGTGWPGGALAHTELNYRRFFTVNDSLIAVRAEDPEVFEATHGPSCCGCARRACSTGSGSTTRTAWPTPAATCRRLRRDRARRVRGPGGEDPHRRRAVAHRLARAREPPATTHCARIDGVLTDGPGRAAPPAEAVRGAHRRAHRRGRSPEGVSTEEALQGPPRGDDRTGRRAGRRGGAPGPPPPGGSGAAEPALADHASARSPLRPRCRSCSPATPSTAPPAPPPARPPATGAPSSSWNCWPTGRLGGCGQGRVPHPLRADRLRRWPPRASRTPPSTAGTRCPEPQRGRRRPRAPGRRPPADFHRWCAH